MTRAVIQFEIGQKTHDRHFTTIFEEIRNREHQLFITACAHDCPGLTERKVAPGDHRQLMAFAAYIRDDDWGPISYVTRACRDYIRYLDPRHSNSLIIKNRIRNMVALGLDGMGSSVGDRILGAVEELDTSSNAQTITDSLDTILDCVEGLIPAHPRMVAYLQEIGADILCVTPLVVSQYGQADLVKAAKAIGIPVVFMVGSWDNLTTKGTIHVMPDFTFVWNEIQREEAWTFHHIPVETVRVVGAARFDDFWERSLTEDRQTFCGRHGLDPTLPILTYLCSSNLISGDERGFVLRWIRALRQSGIPALADANVLIRPHPKFVKGWQEPFSGMKNVGISLSAAPTVKALNNDVDLYHCLAHSRAVVGANTSAELEAAILGRPVFTIKDSELQTGQDGTIHFGYLAGSLATVSSSLGEHISQLNDEMGRADVLGRNDTFLKDFLRPVGLERRASSVTVDALEALLAPRLIDSPPNLRQSAENYPSEKASWASRLLRRI